MNHIETLFNKVGTRKFVAESLGCKLHSVNMMCFQNKVPVKYWPELINLCASKGIEITAHDLMILYNSYKWVK